MTGLIASVLGLFQILGLASSVHAILNTRTPQGTIAWVVCLNVFAIGTVPVYWVLGRNRFQGYVDAWQHRDAEITAQQEILIQSTRPLAVVAPERYPEYEALKTLADMPFLSGNLATLLVDGEAKFRDLFAGIDSASRYILVEYYIIKDDDIGNRLLNKLAAKAAAGVRIYLLYDEVGTSPRDQNWLHAFRDAGIDVAAFDTRQGIRNRFQLNFRNHRKIVVVDGCKAWTGGLNVGDEYLGKHHKLTPWRDTHMRVDGPAALMAQRVFAADWNWARRELLELDWAASPETQPGQAVMVLGSGPAEALETANLFFINTVMAARNRLWIATPYFVPDAGMISALQLAALRGVDVRIITPALNDNFFAKMAAYSYMDELAGLGIRVYEYQRGFMHQKVMLLDERVATVGTANFDNRSFRLNFEVTAVVADEIFAGEVAAMLEDDMRHSLLRTELRLSSRSRWFQLKARGSRLLAPVL